MGNCCIGPINDQPLGLPQGSVRSIIAILTIILAFLTGATTIGILLWKEQYTISVGILGTMFSIISAIVGYYFGGKAADAANNLAANVQHQLLESKNAEVARLTQANDRILQSRGIVMNPHYQNDHVVEIGTN